MSMSKTVAVGVHAALERPCIGGSIEEPRGNTEGANPIASSPCSTDLISLAIHFTSSMAPTRAAL
jgi:hypothetical protein